MKERSGPNGHANLFTMNFKKMKNKSTINTIKKKQEYY